MPESKVVMNVRRAGDRATIVDIEGDVTGFAEQVLMDAFTEASTGNRGVIILNFSGLDYMNSSGIGLLVTLLIRAQRRQQRLLAYGLSEHYRQIFELTRLDDAIPVYATEAKALAAIR
jgi:anti-sigma B factor antagonist